MDSSDPVYVRMVFYLRLDSFEGVCQLLFRLNQVDDGKEAVTVKNLL